jgi:hypothetical protein
MKNYNFGWVPNFLQSPSSFTPMFYDFQRKLTCCPNTKMPHKTVVSISFFLTRVKAVSVWAPLKIIISMGPKLSRVTIFFGSHAPNFLKAPSFLVLLFSDLQQPPTWCSHASDASQEFGLNNLVPTQVNAVSIWAPWKNIIFDAAQTL